MTVAIAGEDQDKRGRGSHTEDGSVPMAGFPQHALDAHVLKLVQAGHSVAICDQVEAPGSTDGLLRREVVRVVTPGTVTEEVLDRAEEVLGELEGQAPGGKNTAPRADSKRNGHVLRVV